jgi:Ca2+-binding RTX toxin-like protein
MVSLSKAFKATVDRGKDVTKSAIPSDVRDLAKSLGSDRPIVGTLGDDVIKGTRKSDVILADPTVRDDVGGDDVVYGRGGDDTIYTFGGDDIVWGGKGDDIIRTADGDDWVDAGQGNDDVQSGRGRDVVLGGPGKDVIRGGEDDDWLDGGEGNDRIIGGSGNDTLIDGPGADRLEGRTGDDLILLVNDATTDRVLFLPDDVGDGVDTISGFDTTAPSEGGDVVDLSELDGVSLLAAADGEDVLLFADPGSDKGPILIARVRSVDLDDLLDDNIITPNGVLVTPTTLEDLDIDSASLPVALDTADALVPPEPPLIA